MHRAMAVLHFAALLSTALYTLVLKIDWQRSSSRLYAKIWCYKKLMKSMYAQRSRYTRTLSPTSVQKLIYNHNACPHMTKACLQVKALCVLCTYFLYISWAELCSLMCNCLVPSKGNTGLCVFTHSEHMPVELINVFIKRNTKSLVWWGPTLETAVS